MRKIISTFFFVTLLFMTRDSGACGGGDGEKCESFEMGYRRVYTKTPTLAIVSSSDEAEEKVHDRKQFFCGLAHQSKILREELIRGSVFGHTASEIQRKIDDQAAVNVAAFAFEFFDEKGEKVGSTYFFGHQDPVKIEKPFFFLSGRKHKAYEAPSGHAWDALDEKAPNSQQFSLHETLKKMKTDTQKCFPKTEEPFIKESLSFDVKMLEQKWLMYMKTVYSRPGGLFFRSLISRHQYLLQENDFCSYYATHASKIESKIISKEAYICNDDKQEDKSGDLLHSEQWGLFKMRENNGLQSFIAWVKGKMPDGGKTIAQAALLIYTRSTMCIRCSTAIICDFFGNKESFKKILERGLLQDDGAPINMGILAVASNHLKSSRLVETDPMDDFERHMRGELIGPNPDQTMGMAENASIDSSAKIFHSFLKRVPILRKEDLGTPGECQFVLQTQDLEKSPESRRFVLEVLGRKTESPQSLFKVARDLIVRLKKNKNLQKDPSFKKALAQLLMDEKFLALHKRKKLLQLQCDAGISI